MMRPKKNNFVSGNMVEKNRVGRSVFVVVFFNKGAWMKVSVLDGISVF